MPYIVYADGGLYAKNKDMAKTILNILEKSEIFLNIHAGEAGDSVYFYEEFDYCHDDTEQKLNETLKKIIPYLRAGSIEFKDEDYNFWKYELYFDDNKWYQAEGSIIYNEPDAKVIIEETEEPNIEEDAEKTDLDL